MIRKSHKVGTIELKEDLFISLNHEVAAWFTEVKIKAGKHDLNIGSNYHTGKPHLFISDPKALIVEDNTPSMFGGVAYSEGNSQKGQTMQQSKEIPFTSSGIIHGNRGKVEFTSDFEYPFLSVDSEGNVKLEQEDPSFKGLILSEKYEMIHNSLNSNRASEEVKRLFNDNKWNEPVNVFALIEAGVAEHTLNASWNDKMRCTDDIISRFGGMLKVDDLIRRHFSTSLHSKDIDIKKVHDIYKTKGGSVSNFPAQTVKEMMEIGMLPNVKPDMDSENSY